MQRHGLGGDLDEVVSGLDTRCTMPVATDHKIEADCVAALVQQAWCVRSKGAKCVLRPYPFGMLCAAWNTSQCSPAGSHDGVPRDHATGH